MFKLVISDDEGKQTVVPLVRDEITVGRKEGNTIRLTERNVSRRHARLVKSNGAFVVEDLNSYNGVRVNGQRIGAETHLEPGDQITIGDYQLALQVEGAQDAQLAQADTAMIAAPGPPARLVMITPPAPGAEFALSVERTRIGRAEDLDIWVNHRSISREHAEIQKEPDGGIRLIDLGSANGVRVNNQDVQNALLEPGDVVELGQVRFRFVGAGEHYAFDADRTVQMDALEAPEVGGGSRAPLFAAIAIVLLAVIGAVVVALWDSGGGETVVRPLDTPSDAVESTEDEAFRGALAACTEAVSHGEGTEALSHADRALAMRADSDEAAACRASAQEIQGQESTFNAGVRHLEAGELPEAYFQFDNLPEGSPLRSRPEARQAVRNYAGLQLAEARQAQSPEDRERFARFVLNMNGITPEQRAQAEALLEGESETVEPDDTTEPAVAVAEAPGERTPRRPRRDRDRDRGRNNGQSDSAANQSPSNDAQNDSPPSNGGGGQSRAVECSINGDNACVIRELEGRTRTATELGLLIEAYRARGQTQEAVGHMRTYVQRYPGTSRARAYQQIISRY